MSDELDQLRAQQALLDRRVGMLERTAGTEASLRAAMSLDSADIKAEQRAQRDMLQAVGVTLSEHTADLRNIKGRLGNVEVRLGNVEVRLEGVETRLGNVEEKLGNVHIGVQAILAVLDRKIDEEGPGGGAPSGNRT